jgi:predicted MFS family arabinose efflux permease
LDIDRDRQRMTALPDQRFIIAALGITQIFAWGSTFYLPAALAPLIASDTGWPYDLTVGGVSVGLLVAGLASPRVGRLIADNGGRPILTSGALLLAVGLLGVGIASSLGWYLVAWIVVGFGMSASLYDAAFSTLGRIYGSRSRTAITAVTLFGGFASTVCWPLSAFLAARFGWRGACLTYAAIQIAVALPIHLLMLPTMTAIETGTSNEKRSPVHLRRDEYVTFGLLAAVLTLGASVLSIIGTQLLPLLTARGFGMSAAVAFGAIVGPSQVGARIIELLVGNRYDPVWTIVASATLVAVAALMLTFEFPIVALAIALYGAGNGIGSVARGTVPLALFGADRYPVLMGRLGFPLLVAMALSPYFAGLAFQNGGPDLALELVTAIALVNVFLVAVLRSMTWRK